MGEDRVKINSYEEYLERYSSQKNRMEDFEFTKDALWRMDRALCSLEFEFRDAETIYHFLIQKARTIPFCEYLKRYIYVRAELDEPFETVPEAVYGEIIRNSFFEKHMVFSFQPSKKRTNALIHGWLTRETARRKTVFLLGFGLGMDDTDVTDFLTGVLGEEDFNFRDPVETVYWYCMHYHQPYAKAQELLEEAGQTCRKPKMSGGVS